MVKMHLIEFNGKVIPIESFDQACFMKQIQLEYYLDSSCVSLQNIQATVTDLLDKYERETYYYRSQIDTILYCCGCIHDLLNNKDRNDNLELYNYNGESYPNLSNRAGRNLIMHLFERNKKILETEGIVGGFNVIYQHGDELDLAVRNNNRRFYAYTLDLLEMKIYFHDMQRDKKQMVDCSPDYEIDLRELEKELLKLSQQAKKVRESFIDLPDSTFRIVEESRITNTR